MCEFIQFSILWLWKRNFVKHDLIFSKINVTLLFVEWTNFICIYVSIVMSTGRTEENSVKWYKIYIWKIAFGYFSLYRQWDRQGFIKSFFNRFDFWISFCTFSFVIRECFSDKWDKLLKMGGTLPSLTFNTFYQNIWKKLVISWFSCLWRTVTVFT